MTSDAHVKPAGAPADESRRAPEFIAHSHTPKWKNYTNLLPGFSNLDARTASALYNRTSNISYNRAVRVAHEDPQTYTQVMENVIGIGFLTITEPSGWILFSKELQTAYLYTTNDAPETILRGSPEVALGRTASTLMKAARWPTENNIIFKGAVSTGETPPYYELGKEIEAAHRIAREAEYAAPVDDRTHTYFTNELIAYYMDRGAEAAREARGPLADEDHHIPLSPSAEFKILCDEIVKGLTELRAKGLAHMEFPKAKEADFEATYTALSHIMRNNGIEPEIHNRLLPFPAPVPVIAKASEPAATSESAAEPKSARRVAKPAALHHKTSMDSALDHFAALAAMQAQASAYYEEHKEEFSLPNEHAALFKRYTRACHDITFLEVHGVTWIGSLSDLDDETLLSNIAKINALVDEDPEIFLELMKEIKEDNKEAIPERIAEIYAYQSRAYIEDFLVWDKLKSAQTPAAPAQSPLAKDADVILGPAADAEPKLPLFADLNKAGSGPTPFPIVIPMADPARPPVASVAAAIDASRAAARAASAAAGAPAAAPAGGLDPDRDLQFSRIPDGRRVRKPKQQKVKEIKAKTPKTNVGNQWAAAAKWVGQFAKKNAPAFLTSVLVGGGIRIGAQFLVASALATTPGLVGTFAAAALVGGITGGLTRLLVTSLYDKEAQKAEHWKKKAFAKGFVTGMLGGTVGAGAMHWAFSHIHFDHLIQQIVPKSLLALPSSLLAFGHHAPVVHPTGSLTVTMSDTSHAPLAAPISPDHPITALPKDTGSLVGAPSVAAPALGPHGAPLPTPAATPSGVTAAIDNANAQAHASALNGHSTPSGAHSSTTPLRPSASSTPAAPDASAAAPQPALTGGSLADVDVKSLVPADQFNQLPEAIQKLGDSNDPEDLAKWAKEASFYWLNHTGHNAASAKAAGIAIKHALDVAQQANFTGPVIDKLHADFAYENAWGIGLAKNAAVAIQHARLAGTVMHNFGGRLLQLLHAPTNG